MSDDSPGLMEEALSVYGRCPTYQKLIGQTVSKNIKTICLEIRSKEDELLVLMCNSEDRKVRFFYPAFEDMARCCENRRCNRVVEYMLRLKKYFEPLPLEELK